MSSTENNSRIDYIEFAVKSVPDAKRFYGNAFGWRFDDYGPDYARFSDGRLTGGFQTTATVQPGGPLVIIYATDLEGMEQKVRPRTGGVVGRRKA